MSTTPNKSKHLSREEREAIEDMLNFHCTFKHIAREIGKDSTTVSKEVKRNPTVVPPRGELVCVNIKNCIYRHSNPRRLCNSSCSFYIMPVCGKLKKAPFVCNGCSIKAKCRLQKSYYRAKEAQAAYKEKLSESRQGINLDAEAFDRLDTVISKGVLNGQSPAHILHTQSESIPVSERTVYRFFEDNLFSACNIDLPRKVRYKPRKKEKPLQNDKKILANRDYLSFLRYISENPYIRIVEGDTVYGSTPTSLLTFQFGNTGFMIARIIPDRKTDSVIRAVHELHSLLELNPNAAQFSYLFPVMLLDNGKEFNDTLRLETDCHGEICTKVFYCDPYSSYQKPHVEKNHEHIRQILPKGTNLDNLTQADVDKMLSHINSYARDSLGGKTPYDVFTYFFGVATALALGIMPIDPASVILKTSLLKD